MNSPPPNEGKYRMNSPPPNEGKYRMNPPPPNEGKYRMNSPPPNEGKYRMNSPPPNEGKYRMNPPPPNEGKYKTNPPPPNEGKYRMNSPPPYGNGFGLISPLNGNSYNYSSVFRSSSVGSDAGNNKKTGSPQPFPRNQSRSSSRTSHSIERPARSSSVKNSEDVLKTTPNNHSLKNQDFIYKSTPNNSQNNDVQRGRPLSREFIPQDQDFQDIGRSQSETVIGGGFRRTPRERPVPPRVNNGNGGNVGNNSFLYERLGQSRYNEIKTRTAAGEYSTLSDLNFVNGERYNRIYGHGRNESNSSNTGSHNGSHTGSSISNSVSNTLSSFTPIPDPIRRPRSENKTRKPPSIMRRGRSEPRRSSRYGFESDTNSLDFLSDYFDEDMQMKRSSKATDSSYSINEMRDSKRRSSSKTKINTQIVEASPLTNYSKNTLIKDPTFGKDFGINIKTNGKSGLENTSNLETSSSVGRSSFSSQHIVKSASNATTTTTTTTNNNNNVDNTSNTSSKSKNNTSFAFNMDDFFGNLENEIDATISATFNTAASHKASRLDDVEEVVEVDDDFIEPVTEPDNKEEKNKKRISSDVLGLVLDISNKRSQPEAVIEEEEEEEPDTEEEDDDSYFNPILSNYHNDESTIPPRPLDERNNRVLSTSFDTASRKDSISNSIASQEAKVSVVVANDTETNENKPHLMINTNPEDLKPQLPIDTIQSTTSEIPPKPITPVHPNTPIVRPDSRNGFDRMNRDSKSFTTSLPPPLPLSSPLPQPQPHQQSQQTQYFQPPSPVTPSSRTYYDSGDGNSIADGLSQDDPANTSIGNISNMSGRSGVLKSFLPSDIADIIENEQDVDTLNISPDYRDNFIDYLTSQQYDDPTKEDFVTVEGYYSWEEKTDKRPLIDVMAQLVDYRFSQEWVEEQERKRINRLNQSNNININKAPEDPNVEISIIVKVIQAQGLIPLKDGKFRNPYCEVKFNGSTFHTEKCENTLDPYWNQHLEVKATNLTEGISIAVWDKKNKEKKKIWKKEHGDEFLGYIKLNVSDLINKAARVGYISQWYNLERRNDKKDKYVGGRILIEAGVGETADIKEEKSLNKNRQDEVSDYELLQNQLINCKVSYKSLFKILLKACLDHDLIYIHSDVNSNSSTSEILSDEAKILLKVFSKQWVLGDAFLVISYLEETFDLYINNRIPIQVIVSTFDVLYDYLKFEGWLPPYEQPPLLDLLEKIVNYHSRQVCHYREYFPKGEPEGVLASAIYIWRLIFKSKIYRESHPELPISFREEIRTQMTKQIDKRYKKLWGLTSPFEENTEDILIGLVKLADLIIKDIDDDLNYYQEIFRKEINIARISSQIYLKSFIKELENNEDRLASPEALESSKYTFELYRRVRLMDRQYSNLVPSLKKMSTTGGGFNIEKWFNDFVISWLKVQQERTLEWVKTAIDTDTLEKISDNQPYSASVIDLFDIMFEEFDLIKGLEWSNTEQYTEFLTDYAKIVTKAIEQYCDAMEKNEMKKEESRVALKHPIDITNKSCIKLSNIEKAIEKVNELFNKIKELNVMEESETKDTYSRLFDGEEITGTFSIEIIYAENLKPHNKNGLSNPYVVIRIPDEDGSNGKNGSTELLKTSIINDTVNPRWDETFQTSIAPTKTLEVCVYNKSSFLSADAIIGKKEIKFNSRWCDHQTHELIVKLEPQGRLLIRITMEGEGEDLQFFFKKSKLRLMRTSNDFIRELVYRITPYIKEVFTKIIKSNETQNTHQLANAYTMSTAVPLTVSGRVANKTVPQEEIEKELLPITDYLNKNLDTLCNNLSSKMAQKVILEIWYEILNLFENLMIPQLYGVIERDRKILNIRQISIIESSLTILFDFFNSDGDELGIPKAKLTEFPIYDEIKLIIRDYQLKIDEIIEQYEKTQKIYLLRILRNHGQCEESRILRERANKFVNQEIENFN
jgi:hypothetical protein